MNPAEFGMYWTQYTPDRMMLDDHNMLSVGMSVMDDITHQTHSMDMNPMMGIVSDYTAATAPGPIAITPEIYPMSMQHHHHLDQQQQTMLEGYHLVHDDDDDEDKNDIGDDNHHIDDQNVLQQHQHHGSSSVKDEDDDDDNSSSMQQYDDDGNADDTVEYHTHFDSDPENSAQSYLIQKTISTQTNKKIKPVKRPGLVLKTPIAYRPCLDPSVIPIQRDGMAVCERCGAIGVKHSFYTKERRFCSMSCARNEPNLLNNMHEFMTNTTDSATNQHDDDIELKLNSTQLQNPQFRFKMSPRHNDDTDGVIFKDLLPQDELPQIPRGARLPSPCPQEEKILTVRRKPSEFYNNYDWNQQLNNATFYAADVTCFSHAPGYDMWENIAVGMKVEVENTDCDNHGIQGVTPHSFWVATVLRICGYKALIRYEGFDAVATSDFWVNLCSSEVHAVGWCATRGKPLIPPRSIENKYSDWKDFLVKRLSGAQTLPTNFYNKISESFKSRFRPGLQLEMVDKNRISQVKLATVEKIVGKRLFVKYYDAPPEDNGFWCHEDSPLIHPVGWASTVGHNLAAPTEYLERMIDGHDQLIEATEDDSVLDLFKMNFKFEDYYLDGKSPGFTEGMKLEAVDPLNLSSICVATVMAVLKFGYMMIRIDSYDPDATDSDWFCYHEKSPCIFPPGFCIGNGIVLTPPRGYETDTFDWDQYLLDTNSQPADTHLFQRELPKTGFQVGMKLECADLMDPRLVCVATIAKMVGRLLKVHFDGWEDEYDQWLDCASPDMYPVGWCVLVGHKLEGPRVLPKIPPVVKVSPKSMGRRKRKSKKAKLDNGKSRNIAIKKDREMYDHQPQRHTNEVKMITTRGDHSGVRIKQEPKLELVDATFDEDDEEDDDFDDEDYSYTASGHSTPLPPTPEPRQTPTLQLDKSNSRSATPSSNQVIPRLSDYASETNLSSLTPDAWTEKDVAQFLRVNDWTAHSDTFERNQIDGKQLMMLTKDEIIKMLSNKVGPSLKIYELIQQLKCKINPNQSRIMKANINKKFL